MQRARRPTPTNSTPLADFAQVPPLRLAVATRCLGSPLTRVLSAAASTGAQGIQIDARHELPARELSATGRRQFLHRLDEAGLRVAGLVFPTRRALHDEDQLEARVEAVRGALQFAFELGGPVLTVPFGELPGADDPRRSILVEVLDDLVRYAGRVGTTLALATRSLTPEVVTNLLDDLADGPVGVELDPAGCVFGRHDPATFVRSLHDRIVHVRLRDGVRDVDGSGLEVPVGRGDVEWEELLPTLDEANYRGWLTAERTTGDDPPGDVQRAIAFTRRVVSP